MEYSNQKNNSYIKSTLVDLSHDEYKITKVNKKSDNESSKYVVSSNLSKTNYPIYTLNNNISHAITGVMYSRLCDKIGLPCIRTCYGINAQIPKCNFLLELKSYSDNWIEFSTWKTNNDVKDLSNYPDYCAHKLLSLFFCNTTYSYEDDGYIIYNKYIKKNSPIPSLQIHYFIEGNKHSFQPVPLSNKQLHEETKKLGAIKHSKLYLQKLSNLTHEDILEIIDTPEYANSKDVHELCYQIIKRIITIAKYFTTYNKEPKSS